MRDKPPPFRTACSILALAFFLACGCGPGNRASVSGEVTLDGQVLETGAINFFPTDGNSGPTAGGTINNGRYEVGAAKGVALGANRVTITSMQKTGRKVYGLGDELADVVPPPYNVKSTLVVHIQPGDNELNFDLQGRVPIESTRSRYPPGPAVTDTPGKPKWRGQP